MAEEKKGIGTLLSDALNVITENPSIIIPYLIPMVLALIAALVAVGTFVPQGVDFTHFEPDPEYFLDNALAFIGFASIFGVLGWIFEILAVAFAITITYNALQGKKVSLGEAWEQIGIGKIVVLLVVSIILAILYIIGFFLLCIGLVIFYVLFIFTRQSVVVDDMSIGAALGNSWDLAKKNFFDILILAIILLLIGAIVGIIPVIGGALGYLVGMYGVVTYTIMYLDRK